MLSADNESGNRRPLLGAQSSEAEYGATAPRIAGDDLETLGSLGYSAFAVPGVDTHDPGWRDWCSRLAKASFIDPAYAFWESSRSMKAGISLGVFSAVIAGISYADMSIYGSGEIRKDLGDTIAINALAGVFAGISCVVNAGLYVVNATTTLQRLQGLTTDQVKEWHAAIAKSLPDSLLGGTKPYVAGSIMVFGVLAIASIALASSAPLFASTVAAADGFQAVIMALSRTILTLNSIVSLPENIKTLVADLKVAWEGRDWSKITKVILGSLLAVSYTLTQHGSVSRALIEVFPSYEETNLVGKYAVEALICGALLSLNFDWINKGLKADLKGIPGFITTIVTLSAVGSGFPALATYLVGATGEGAPIPTAFSFEESPEYIVFAELVAYLSGVIMNLGSLERNAISFEQYLEAKGVLVRHPDRDFQAAVGRMGQFVRDDLAEQKKLIESVVKYFFHSRGPLNDAEINLILGVMKGEITPVSEGFSVMISPEGQPISSASSMVDSKEALPSGIDAWPIAAFDPERGADFFMGEFPHLDSDSKSESESLQSTPGPAASPCLASDAVRKRRVAAVFADASVARTLTSSGSSLDHVVINVN